MDTIVEFQESGEFEKSLNASFVVIIPQREGASCMKDYRPLSLVGSRDGELEMSSHLLAAVCGGT